MVKKLICGSCQSILEYIKADIMYDAINYGRYDQYVICPICNHKNYIIIN